MGNDDDGVFAGSESRNTDEEAADGGVGVSVDLLNNGFDEGVEEDASWGPLVLASATFSSFPSLCSFRGVVNGASSLGCFRRVLSTHL